MSTIDRPALSRRALVQAAAAAIAAPALAQAPGTAPGGQGAASVAPAAAGVPQAIVTPDRVETRLGALQFRDGIPTAETAAALYEHLDLQRGTATFLNAFSGVSMYAIRQGFRDAGVADGDVLIFSQLMDSKSLFLTGNCDTVYFLTFLDLSRGPLVVETPPEALGVVDDIWFRWITDFGQPGPDRGEGGRYLLLPPGYAGPLPEGGHFVARSRSNAVGVLGRAFLVNNDPAPAVASIRQHMKIYPYVPGGYGTSIGSFLLGRSPLAQPASPTTPRFVEGSGLVMNTIPPNDLAFYTMLHGLVQGEPAEALDPEIAGQFAAIGIVKGRGFEPNERLRRILAEAAAIGNAASRVVGFRPRPEEGFAYYGAGSSWLNPLFVGGYDFMGPPPAVTPQGVQPFPATGARTLDVRTSFFYMATGVTPAMVMRLPQVGSQYLWATFDARGNPFDGARTYRVTLPPNIPAARFWSLTLYDNQTRSMLATEQRYPRAGSQSYPSPAAAAASDGSTTVTFGPARPAGVAAGNWIQTVPGKGWFPILRLYSPLQTFFDKTWRIGEIAEAGA